MEQSNSNEDQACANCAHWVPIEDESSDRYFQLPDEMPPQPLPGPEVPRPIDWSARSRDAWGTNWGTCQREFEAGSPMFTNDASEYFSALRTKPSFVCSAWDPKGRHLT